MLKESIKYTDFDDVEQSEMLYFNLTKTEMMDMLDMQPRLEAYSKISDETEARKLTPTEIKELLAIIKELIEKAYGVRSEDGKHFRKSPAIFDDFRQTAVYDAFVFGLFENPERAINFMIGILPKGLDDDAIEQVREDATAELKAMDKTAEVQDIPLPGHVPTLDATDKEVPAYLREDREPTRAELGKMTPDQLSAAFQKKLDKSRS